MNTELIDWHKRRFPKATGVDVLIKLVEEVGELASAILGEELGGKGVTRDELGDVLICATVLAERYMCVSAARLLEERIANVTARPR